MITAFNKKKKLNPMLMNVIIISVLLHIAAGFVAGIVTIATHVIKEDAQFEEPPVVEEEQPPPDVKVQIKPQDVPKNQPLQNLKMKQVGNISVANVNVSLPSMGDSFTVSAGLGNIAGGNLLGGARGNLGIGMSDVSVFGLKTRAERILFIIDANRQMLTDEKGGLNSYQVIKDEITDMVGNLSAGTLFNVMLQDRRKTLMFKPKLVAAGADVHAQLEKWIAQVNSNPSSPGLEGIRGANTPKLAAMPDDEIHELLEWSRHRGNETGFITQLALEQDADAIFLITGYHRGFENMRRPPNDKEEQAWQKKIADKKYQEQLAAHELEIPQMRKRIDKEMAKINAERKQKGMPPRVLGIKYGIRSEAHELGLKWKSPHPGTRPSFQVDSKDVVKYFRKLVRTLYAEQNKTQPSLNVVLFLAGDEEYKPDWEKQLSQYVRQFDGKNRIIRGEDEIKSARSAQNTRN